MNRAYAVIAGGGTGGHVIPAVAIGRALVERGHPRDTIHFVGSKRGIDRRLVEPEGFPLHLLPGRGLARRLTVDNLGAAAGLLVAVARSLVLLLRLRPRVVVSMGGYAAAPCGVLAGLLRIPLVLAEQNAVPTATHRLLARFAVASAVPFAGTPLPNPTVTGNPVRREVLAVDTSPAGRAAARERLGLPGDRFVLAAFGGSLGALSINRAVWGLAAAWRHRADLAIRHVVGERDWPLLEAEGPGDLSGHTGLVYQPVEYEHDMPTLLAAADLAVCRAGGSVAELAVCGLPAILVPLPIAPFGHQAANAEAVVAGGGGRHVPDGELTAERLAAEVDPLIGDRRRLEEMAEGMRGLAFPDAAARVAELVESHARG